MENKITGNEFGLFDYSEYAKEDREEKWMAISYLIEQGKIHHEDVATIFQNNPFFFDWYKRTILSDLAISETYH